MTIIGKILTVFLFLFSLVFLGFAFTINTLNKDRQTGKSWYSVAMELKTKSIPALQADVKARDEELAALRGQIATLNNEVKSMKENVTKEVDQKNNEVQRAKTEADAAKRAFEKSQIDLKAALEELDKRRQEVARAYETIKQKNSELAQLVTDKTNAMNLKTQFEVAASSLTARNQSMERQIKDLTEQVESLQVMLNDPTKRLTTKSTTVGDVVPVPNDVEGIVKAVGNDGLVSISIGSDAGLLRGHTLEVFRLKPQPMYLGRMTIKEVSPHEAVGQIIDPKFRKLVQPNDIVANRIIQSR